MRSQARMAARRYPTPNTSRAIRRLSNERGAVAVEFALVLPVICLMLFAIIQFGITLNNYIELANAVTAGERAISTSRGSTTPYNNTEDAIIANAPNLSWSQMTVTITVNNGTANGSCTTDTATKTVSACSSLFPTTAGADPSTVTITYPCKLTFFTIKFTPCTLSSTSTEFIQ